MAGRWPGGPARAAQAHLLVCTDGGRGTSDPSVDPADLAKLRAEELAEAAELIGLASCQVLGCDGRRARRPGRFPGRAGRLDPPAAAGRGARPRPDGGLLRPGLLQPPGPPGRRVGAPRRPVAGGGPPALLPGGRPGPPGGDGVPVGHARAGRLGRRVVVGRGQGGGRRVPPAASSRPATGGPARRSAVGPKRRAGGPASPTPRGSAACGSVADRAGRRRPGDRPGDPPRRHGQLLRRRSRCSTTRRWPASR